MTICSWVIILSANSWIQNFFFTSYMSFWIDKRNTIILSKTHWPCVLRRASKVKFCNILQVRARSRATTFKVLHFAFLIAQLFLFFFCIYIISWCKSISLVDAKVRIWFFILSIGGTRTWTKRCGNLWKILNLKIKNFQCSTNLHKLLTLCNPNLALCGRYIMLKSTVLLCAYEWETNDFTT